ncbi:autophagy-related protein 9-like [Impatiens glandulifera]|uniref:autophagy-related protein 9-like n=1 Tax=Impatiens glandulifera TaxID=253017 RepID=UPI001FB0A5F0|nr:autophagy-related protein 9-like [Impatiens glandulifera]XP_047316038.1 autophagy-related protein 9-like [Impatiens glandulifera]
MFNWAKGHNALNIFKAKRHDGDSSLETGLLNDIPYEIELSDYRGAPSPGSESPSGLLDGECLNGEPIADLDLFFERLYTYYCEKGLWCIIIKWVVELLSLAFTICFSGFFLLFVDWDGLRNAKCGMVAVESGMKPCDLAKEALHQHPLTPFTLSKAVIVGYLGIFSIYLIFCFLRFFAQLNETLKIRQFYYKSLSVTDNEIQTMPWASILEKVVQLQSSQQLCVVKDLSAHDVVMRLMRKENYLIGMLNKGVLAFPISQWVPGAGPTAKYGSTAKYRLILTKTLEWTLNWCILQSMFDRNFCVRTDFVSSPKTLKRRLIIVGFVMLLLSPFLVIFMLVYLFLRHAEQFYNHPSTASSRRWSNLAKWIFREFNEVDHLFKHRVNNSVPHASDYIRQFPSPIVSIIAKFISFVSGGFAAILIIIAFVEESLLEGHIFGRNLLWYAAVFGTITAISRAAVTDELLVLDAQTAMSLVVQHSHYMPKRWRGKENTEFARMEFETLFQYTGMMLLEEMASIFLTPYLLMFVVPQRADDILQFITDFTVHVEGVGHVCSFSAFDFRNHGNSNYGSPYNTSQIQRSSQGKMEKSFLSFHSSYPSWEPDVHGKQFLLNLTKFREQNLQEPGIIRTTPQRAQHFRSSEDIDNNYMSMDFPQQINARAPNHFGSMWMFDNSQRNCPYILDCYYYAFYQLQNQVSDNSRNIDLLEQSNVTQVEDSRNFWMPMVNKEIINEESWGDLFHNDDNNNRSRSHLEASTSAPLFQESILRHHDDASFPPGSKSHWWARSNRHGNENPATSFLDPPVFNGEEEASNYQRSFLEPRFFNRNHEDEDEDDKEDEDLNWRRSFHGLSKTFFMDELEGGEFSLPFDDIYSRPTPENSGILEHHNSGILEQHNSGILEQHDPGILEQHDCSNSM